MEQQRLQLENLKWRMQNGETVESRHITNGEYVVQLSGGTSISFDEHYKQTVDHTISKAQNGVRENTLNNNSTPSSARERPNLNNANM